MMSGLKWINWNAAQKGVAEENVRAPVEKGYEQGEYSVRWRS